MKDEIDYLIEAIGYLASAISASDWSLQTRHIVRANGALRSARDVHRQDQLILITPKEPSSIPIEPT
jgi:hypothetical protein